MDILDYIIQFFFLVYEKREVEEEADMIGGDFKKCLYIYGSPHL